VQVEQTIPLLRIFDVERAKAFYVGFLGFGNRLRFNEYR
jgi:hypothetical protein